MSSFLLSGFTERDVINEGQRAVPRFDNSNEATNKTDVTKDNEAIIIHRTDLDAAIGALGVLDAMQAKYLGPTHKARLETQRLINTLQGK